MGKTCACNTCIYGPPEEPDKAPAEPQPFWVTEDIICGIGDNDAEGSFISGYRYPVYLKEGEVCPRLQEFQRYMEIKRRKAA